MLLGSLAAALLGLGLGAWLKPPAVEAANPDPYENVVITVPAEPAGPSWAAFGAVSYVPAAVADSPDSRIAWADPGGRSAESASWSLPWDNRSDPEVLTPAKLEQALPDPATDESPSWPSRQGDILATTASAPAQPSPQAQPLQTVQTVQAHSRDPRDWDVPDSAYRRAGFDMRAGAETAPAG